MNKIPPTNNAIILPSPSPVTPLRISSSDAAPINNVTFAPSLPSLSMTPNGTQHIHISSNGTVGIGTTTPHALITSYKVGFEIFKVPYDQPAADYVVVEIDGQRIKTNTSIFSEKQLLLFKNPKFDNRFRQVAQDQKEKTAGPRDLDIDHLTVKNIIGVIEGESPLTPENVLMIWKHRHTILWEVVSFYDNTSVEFLEQFDALIDWNSFQNWRVTLSCQEFIRISKYCDIKIAHSRFMNESFMDELIHNSMDHEYIQEIASVRTDLIDGLSDETRAFGILKGLIL